MINCYKYGSYQRFVNGIQEAMPLNSDFLMRAKQMRQKSESGVALVEAASCRFPQRLRLEATATRRDQCHSEFLADQEV